MTGCRVIGYGRDDRGFTMAEVMMATAIFLFALTALMSLMVTSTVSASKAREKATLVNACNSYIERVRAMPYDTVNALSPTTMNTNGYNITLTPTVTWVDDPTISGTTNYKKLIVVASAKRGSENTMSYTAETVIKETDSGTNSSALSPIIDFTSSSPAQLAVVWGNSVNVGATASAQGTNVTLTSMQLEEPSPNAVLTFLRSATGTTAQWSVSGASETRTFQWDTTTTYEGQPAYLDGLHTIRATVVDSNQRMSYVDRQVIVDNSPPSQPGSLTSTTPSSTAIGLKWSVVADQGLPADHYVMYAWKQLMNPTDVTDNVGWDYLGTRTTTSPQLTYTVTPLSRYAYRLYAVSPRNLYSSPNDYTVVISRPSATGSWVTTTSGNGSKKTYASTLTFNVSSAQFPYSAVTNTLMRGTNASMTDETAVSSVTGTWTLTDSLTGASSGVPVYYYRVRTVITPLGYAGGTAKTLYSQVLGPNNATSASGTMATAAW